ncbi:hypothetical protein OnM2_085014 [Erysiphe neolycopersici]|uniref:C2H2-type domain-containing protein n=1 Tax=Erysiphe neolycopersici TaxID=212602 RepID=A0A420HEQ2_9PEZI|nr:hypothetical protein OnM2_085014 [Erysiphe neolycopersici]
MASSNDSPLPQASSSSTLSDEQFSKLVEAVRAQIAPASSPFAAEITNDFISQLTFAIQNKIKSSSVKVDSTQASLTSSTNLPGMNIDYSLRPQDIGFFSSDNEASNSTSFVEGEAELRYTNELSVITRAGLPTNLNFWCSELERRFQESPSVALSKLERLRYTVRDVQARKKPEEFVNRIIVLWRHAGTATTEYTQILTAYHYIDAALRVSLSKPTNFTTLSNFMANITETKEIWFDLYRPVFSSYTNDVPHSRSMPPANNYKLQGRRYLPNPFTTQNKFQEPQGRQNYRTPLNRPMGKYGSRQYLPQQKPSDRWHNHTNRSENPLKAAPNFPAKPLDSNGVFFQEYDNSDVKYEDPFDDNENRYKPDTYHISNTLLPNVDSTITKNKPAATYRSAFKKSQSPILCSICNKSFSSRNRLQNRIRTLHEKSKKPTLVETDPLSIVVSTVKNSISPPGFAFRVSQTKEDFNGLIFAFRESRYAQILIMLHSPGNDKTWVCLDSGCPMSLIDKNFLLQQYPTAKLLTMSTPMTVRRIGNHTYDASQFLQVDIFLPNGSGCAGHIKKELHVVNCLPAKALLGVDIMLPEGWCVDFESQTLTLPYCSGIQVPILVKSAFPEGPIPIFSKQRKVIPPHSNALISISSNHGTPLNLPPCDLIYKPSENNSLTTYTHLLGPYTDKILVQNNTSYPFSLA